MRLFAEEGGLANVAAGPARYQGGRGGDRHSQGRGLISPQGHAAAPATTPACLRPRLAIMAANTLPRPSYAPTYRHRHALFALAGGRRSFGDDSTSASEDDSGSGSSGSSSGSGSSSSGCDSDVECGAASSRGEGSSGSSGPGADARTRGPSVLQDVLTGTLGQVIGGMGRERGGRASRPGAPRAGTVVDGWWMGRAPARLLPRRRPPPCSWLRLQQRASYRALADCRAMTPRPVAGQTAWLCGCWTAAPVWTLARTRARCLVAARRRGTVRRRPGRARARPACRLSRLPGGVYGTHTLDAPPTSCLVPSHRQCAAVRGPCLWLARVPRDTASGWCALRQPRVQAAVWRTRCVHPAPHARPLACTVSRGRQHCAVGCCTHCCRTHAAAHCTPSFPAVCDEHLDALQQRGVGARPGGHLLSARAVRSLRPPRTAGRLPLARMLSFGGGFNGSTNSGSGSSNDSGGSAAEWQPRRGLGRRQAGGVRRARALLFRGLSCVLAARAACGAVLGFDGGRRAQLGWDGGAGCVAARRNV